MSEKEKLEKMEMPNPENDPENETEPENEDEPETYYKKLEKTVDETLDSVSDELFADLDEHVPAYSPERSYTILSDMIRINTLNNPNRHKAFEQVSQELQKQLLDLIGAIIKLYDTEKTTLDDKSKKVLLDALTLDKTGLYGSLEITKHRYKYLMREIPGKSIQDKQNAISRHVPDVSEEVLDKLDELNEHRKGLNELISAADDARDGLIQELLEHTWFWDIVLGKNIPELTNILSQFLGRNPEVFYSFMAAKRPGLDEHSPKHKNPVTLLGLEHIVQNRHFAYSLIQNIPPKYWDSSIIYPFITVMLDKEITGKMWQEFMQLAGTLPVENQKKIVRAAVKMAGSITYDQDRSGYNLPNLIYLMRLSNQEVNKIFADFLTGNSVKFTNMLLSSQSSFELQKSLFQNLSLSDRGRALIRQSVLPDGQNWFWSLYNHDRCLNDKDAQVIIQDAIKNKDTKFLLHKKTCILTDSFPGYKEICSYFQNQDDAFRFISSFANNHYAQDQRFSFIRNFITDPQKVLEIARQENLVFHWARQGDDKKILSLLFDGDLDLLRDLKPRVPTDKMLFLLDQKDENGCTPWHYFCKNHSRLFFSKNFKALHPSLVQAARQADNDGNTPISYICSDSKFKKMVIEKIPAMAKLMEEMGVDLDYVPLRKEKNVKEVKPAQQVAPRESDTQTQGQTSEETPEPLKWRVVRLGNDKERKDPLYCEAIQRRIDELPPPQSGSISLGNQRMKTKLFQAPTFKIWHNNTQWRIPFIKDDAMQIIFIMPGSDRSETYTNGDYCRSIRNFGKWIRHQQGKNPQYHPHQRS